MNQQNATIRNRRGHSLISPQFAFLLIIVIASGAATGRNLYTEQKSQTLVEIPTEEKTDAGAFTVRLERLLPVSGQKLTVSRFVAELSENLENALSAKDTRPAPVRSVPQKAYDSRRPVNNTRGTVKPSETMKQPAGMFVQLPPPQFVVFIEALKSTLSTFDPLLRDHVALDGATPLKSTTTRRGTGLQLNLSSCELGQTGKLLVLNRHCIRASGNAATSSTDGETASTECATQHLTGQLFDEQSRADWGKKTAFYNGEQFDLVLFGDPTDSKIQCDLMSKELNAAIRYPTPGDLSLFAKLGPAGESPTENVSKNSPIGRLYPVGCTGWLAEGTGYAVTAGHCCCDERCDDNEWKACKHLSNSILQFHVPPSINGEIRHPDPQDQYPMKELVKLQFDGKGCSKIGNDWAVFELGANKTPRNGTRRVALEEQGGLRISRAPLQAARRTGASEPVAIDMVGYGINLAERNKHLTLQPSKGMLSDCPENPNCLKYDTEATPGMSGGPILATGSNTVIGIHTDGFPCDCDGPTDAGTSFMNSEFCTAATGNQSSSICN